MIKDPISTSEAAEILERDPSAIRHMIRAKTLTAEKFGRDHQISRKLVEGIKAKRDAKRNGKPKGRRP